MPVRYWIPPDTTTAVCRNGGPFEPFTTDKALIFEQPIEESADDLTFAGVGFQVRVAKSLVYRCEWDGNGGRNLLCG